ncbi:MAG: hypothetical protein Q8O49_01350 [bacterium]|nr:hypothetical protein [bacterium]
MEIAVETKILLIYFAIGFILFGWRLDLIEKAEKDNGQQKSGFSKFLAFCWLFLWILPIILRIIKITLLINTDGRVMTWREISENAKSED